MTDKQIVDGSGRSLSPVPCPLCGRPDPTPLIPCCKLSLGGKKQWKRHDHIRLCLCEHCGLAFESPQTVVESSQTYAEDFYYNAGNPVSGHDDLQHRWAAYNWHALKDALPWSSFRSVMDVGAAGAWSQWIRDHVPSVERAALAEPSPQAIFNCELRYPQVTGELGVFEDFDIADGSFDLITFHNSFYAVTRPKEALDKIHRLLADDGHAVIAFSYLGMKLDFWQEKEAGITLSHVVRGVPIIYYSPNTARKMVQSCGFEVVDEVVFQVPEWDPLGGAGRQLFYLVLRKSHATAAPTTQLPADPDECAFARRFYTRFCEDVTDRSLDYWVSSLDEQTRERLAKAPGLTLLHDSDRVYAEWAQKKLLEHGVVATLFDGGDLNVERLVEELPGEEGQVIMTAGNIPNADIKQLAAGLRPAEVVDASPRANYQEFGNWITTDDGNTVVARPLAPVRDREHRVFPYDRLPCVNETTITAQDLGYAVEDRMRFPQWVYESIPRLAGTIAQAALERDTGERRRLLEPFLQHAGGPLDASSIGAQHSGVAPTNLCLPDLEGLCRGERLSAIRPTVQWGLLRASQQDLRALLAHARAQGVDIPEQAPGPVTQAAS